MESLRRGAAGWSGLEEAMLLPTSQRKKVWISVAYTLPLHTGVIVSLCQSVSAALNLIIMVSTFQEAPKHPGEILTGDEVKRPCKTSSGLKPGPSGTDAVFLCSPYDKAWCFCMNGTSLSSIYFPLHPHRPGMESSRRHSTSLSELWNVSFIKH